MGQSSDSNSQHISEINMSSVVVNMLWLRPGQVGGSETYSVQLLEAISQSAKAPPIKVALTPATYEAHQFLREAFEITRHQHPLGRIGRILKENRLFSQVNSQQVTHHLGGTIPQRDNSSKIVVTIYDVQYRTYPQYFSLAKRRYLDTAIQRTLQQAETVCVISEFCAQSLENHFGYPKEKCHIIPPAFHSPTAQQTQPIDARPFLLYPAVTWPHKSHKFLITLMEQIADLELILTGAKGPAHKDVMQAIRRSSARDRITHLGHVEHQRLDSLYRQALCTVFPSQYEGFGQPIIEAMLRGCPVITSQCGALPETVGAGGITLPMDFDQWRDAIGLLAEPGQRQLWVDAGRRRAADFSYQRSAEAQVAAYEELLGR